MGSILPWLVYICWHFHCCSSYFGGGSLRTLELFVQYSMASYSVSLLFILWCLWYVYVYSNGTMTLPMWGQWLITLSQDHTSRHTDSITRRGESVGDKSDNTKITFLYRFMERFWLLLRVDLWEDVGVSDPLVVVLVLGIISNDVIVHPLRNRSHFMVSFSSFFRLFSGFFPYNDKLWLLYSIYTLFTMFICLKNTLFWIILTNKKHRKFGFEITWLKLIQKIVSFSYSQKIHLSI